MPDVWPFAGRAAGGVPAAAPGAVRADPVLPLMAAYAAAVAAKDAEALAALYDPDTRIYDLWDAWSYDGRDAWRVSLREWFRSLGANRVAVSFSDIRSTVGTELAVAHATVCYTELCPNGGALRAMSNRITWALRNSGGTWRIVHEHTSAPIDTRTSTIIKRVA